jgi:AICAR transformylase/IMP cyclohydrolase PurH
VKTLHLNIHASRFADCGKDSHLADLGSTASSLDCRSNPSVPERPGIDTIDIGGPRWRAAAKNYVASPS